MGCERGWVCEVRFVGDRHGFRKGDELQREKCWKERWTGAGDGLERQKGLGEEDGFGDGHGLGRELG